MKKTLPTLFLSLTFSSLAAAASTHPAAERAFQLFNNKEGSSEQTTAWQINAHTPLSDAGTHVHITRYHGETEPALSWQLLLTPDLTVQDIQRTELPYNQAQQQACFGNPCLISTLENQGSWQALSPVNAEHINAAPQQLLNALFAEATAPFGEAELNEAASLAEPEWQWLIKKAPETGALGLQGTLLQANQMDDAIQHSWTRVQTPPQQEPRWERRIDYRPGRS